MGSLYLTNLPSFFEKWGVPYDLYSGWETRSRSTGGFNPGDPKAIFIHHTASDTACENDVNYCAVGHQDAPVGNGVLCRSGVFHFFAAGAANCQGKGGPAYTSSGTIPLDTGNSQGFAIEASCNGVGQPWTPEQNATYPLLCAAIADCLDMDPMLDVISHAEWAPTRKCDPAGPSPWMPASGPGCSPSTGGITWNEDLFRSSVRQILDSGGLPSDDMMEFYRLVKRKKARA